MRIRQKNVAILGRGYNVQKSPSLHLVGYSPLNCGESRSLQPLGGKSNLIPGNYHFEADFHEFKWRFSN